MHVMGASPLVVSLFSFVCSHKCLFMWCSFVRVALLFKCSSYRQALCLSSIFGLGFGFGFGFGFGLDLGSVLIWVWVWV